MDRVAQQVIDIESPDDVALADRMKQGRDQIITELHKLIIGQSDTIDQVLLSHRALVQRIMAHRGAAEDPWEAWSEAHAAKVAQTQGTIGKLLAEKTFDLAKLAVAQGVLSDLVLVRDR